MLAPPPLFENPPPPPKLGVVAAVTLLMALMVVVVVENEDFFLGIRKWLEENAPVPPEALALPLVLGVVVAVLAGDEARGSAPSPLLVLVGGRCCCVSATASAASSSPPPPLVLFEDEPAAAEEDDDWCLEAAAVVINGGCSGFGWKRRFCSSSARDTLMEMPLTMLPSILITTEGAGARGGDTR